MILTWLNANLKASKKILNIKRVNGKLSYKALESNKSGDSDATIQVEDFKGQLQNTNSKIESLQTNLIANEPRIRPKITCPQKPFNSLNNLVLAIGMD